LGKPILCLDFDGVIHSYSSGWKGADNIPDPPVPGSLEFIRDAQEHFRVAIFSSRSNQPGGLLAMQTWLERQGVGVDGFPAFVFNVEWPIEKPPAMVTIDDRALTFTGNWSEYDPAELLRFQPWNKKVRDAAA
jgi:hypothetical protein